MFYCHVGSLLLAKNAMHSPSSYSLLPFHLIYQLTVREKLVCVDRVLAEAGKQGGVTLLFFNSPSFFSLPPSFLYAQKICLAKYA